MARTDDERQLIEAAQKDPRRFGELYERNFERVYAFVARRVRDRHEVEDVTAEVFQHALANLSKFEWRGVPFAVWLFRIAANIPNFFGSLAAFVACRSRITCEVL